MEKRNWVLMRADRKGTVNNFMRKIPSPSLPQKSYWDHCQKTIDYSVEKHFLCGWWFFHFLWASMSASRLFKENRMPRSVTTFNNNKLIFRVYWFNNTFLYLTGVVRVLNGRSWVLLLLGRPRKFVWPRHRHPSKSAEIFIPFTHQNGSKTVSATSPVAVHTYIAYKLGSTHTGLGDQCDSYMVRGIKHRLSPVLAPSLSVTQPGVAWQRTEGPGLD